MADSFSAMRAITICLALALAACSSDAASEASTKDASASGGSSGKDGSSDSTLADVGKKDAPSDAVTGDGATNPAKSAFLYVSIGAEPRLAVLRMAESGSLTARPELDLTLPENPRALGWDASGRKIYAGLANGDIATIAVDASGKPTLLGTTPGAGEEPVYVATTPDGTRIVSAYFGSDLLKVHDTSAAPPHALLDSVSTSDEPHQAFVHAGLVYVPHRNGMVTRWFTLTSAGKLVFENELASEPGAGPRHIAFSPAGVFAYIVNEYSDSVSAHSVGSDGALSRFETKSTLSSGTSSDQNSSADVHVSPDGKHLYASNRGDDTIAVFDVAADGSLNLRATVPTEARPREFDLAPSGRLLTVAGQDSGQVASYTVDDAGDLTFVERLAVGGDLRWIVTVED